MIIDHLLPILRQRKSLSIVLGYLTITTIFWRPRSSGSTRSTPMPHLLGDNFMHMFLVLSSAAFILIALSMDQPLARGGEPTRLPRTKRAT